MSKRIHFIETREFVGTAASLVRQRAIDLARTRHAGDTKCDVTVELVTAPDGVSHARTVVRYDLVVSDTDSTIMLTPEKAAQAKKGKK